MTQYLGTTCLVIIAHVATMARCLAYTMLPPDSFTTNVCALLLQTLHGTVLLSLSPAKTLRTD